MKYIILGLKDYAEPIRKADITQLKRFIHCIVQEDGYAAPMHHQLKTSSWKEECARLLDDIHSEGSCDIFLHGEALYRVYDICKIPSMQDI